MDMQLKQRVVGAAVLVALGVIFIPILLEDSSDEVTVTSPSVVPPAPEFSSRVVPIQDDTMDLIESAITAPPEKLVDIELDPLPAEPPPSPSSEEPLPDEASAAKEPSVEEPLSEHAPDTAQPVDEITAPPLAANANALPGDAWVIQLGSFKSNANALQLVERLKKDGYTAFIQAHGDGTEKSFRVRVGPELTKLTASKMRDEIEKLVKLKGLLIRYP